MAFQNDFVWGAATSSYQIEGAAYQADKGLNIWDIFCKQPGRVFGGHTGEVACDHYHLFRQDVALMKEMGIKAYRFSINWARLIPQGTGKVSADGLRFYNELIDCLLENGIEPYLTLYHWELPLALHQQGGWMNPQSPEWFGEYAGVIAEHFSDRVRYYFTFNEPQVFVGHGCVNGIHAPGLTMSPWDTFAMAHNVLKAHGMAARALREKARGEIKIGYAPTASLHYPASESAADIEAARQACFALPDVEGWTWNVPWWSDPVILGHYPEEGLRKYHPYLPKITPEDMALIHQKLDFFGQNIYNGSEVRMGEDGKPQFVPRYAGFPKTALDWPVTPEALYWGPKFLCERYSLPLYITENGLSCHDVVSLDGQVHDPNRIDFLARYLGALKRAVQDGVPVKGYFHWSLLDNFEWHSGYAERFGMVYVDYRTQQRIIKDSGYWYKKIIEENGASL